MPDFAKIIVSPTLRRQIKDTGKLPAVIGQIKKEMHQKMIDSPNPRIFTVDYAQNIIKRDLRPEFCSNTNSGKPLCIRFHLSYNISDFTSDAIRKLISEIQPIANLDADEFVLDRSGKIPRAMTKLEGAELALKQVKNAKELHHQSGGPAVYRHHSTSDCFDITVRQVEKTISDLKK
ncbi:MAG: hypothetical protein NTW79_03550 [Candidatus Berkelbacteria bacterium]|nr:hypothetical protein [Candidatus Berkelbacteria bacterium]